MPIEPYSLPGYMGELPALEMQWIADGDGLRSVWIVRQRLPFKSGQSEFVYGPKEIVDARATWAA